MGSFIPQKPFSLKYEASRQRIKRLTDDKFMASVEASNKKHLLKKAANKVLNRANDRKNNLTKCNGSLRAKIERHLSKGRDAGSIAVWENLRVSDVQKIIEEIKK